jgi:hypothetical protein
MTRLVRINLHDHIYTPTSPAAAAIEPIQTHRALQQSFLTASEIQLFIPEGEGMLKTLESYRHSVRRTELISETMNAYIHLSTGTFSLLEG